MSSLSSPQGASTCGAGGGTVIARDAGVVVISRGGGGALVGIGCDLSLFWMKCWMVFLQHRVTALGFVIHSFDRGVFSLFVVEVAVADADTGTDTGSSFAEDS
jgi:hypothetical protein